MHVTWDLAALIGLGAAGTVGLVKLLFGGEMAKFKVDLLQILNGRYYSKEIGEAKIADLRERMDHVETLHEAGIRRQGILDSNQGS